MRGFVFAACAIALVAAESTGRAQSKEPPAQAAPAAPDQQKLDDAKRHFQLGLNLLRDPEGERIEAAYLEFKIAYELSKSPRVLGNIGYCAMKLERNSEAVATYREYLAKVPSIDPVERAQIDQDLVTMTQGGSTVTARFSGTGEWTLTDERVPVRGAAITNTYGPATGELTLLVHPGHHVVRLKVGGEDQGSWEFDSTSGTTHTHTFAPAPAAPIAVATAPLPAPVPIAESRPPASHTAQWIMIGAGGAMLVAGSVTGILALGKMHGLESTCPQNQCPDDAYHSDVTAGRTLGTATDILLIGGGAVAAGGALWLLLGGSNSHEQAAPKSPKVSGACAPGTCGLSLRGTF